MPHLYYSNSISPPAWHLCPHRTFLRFASFQMAASGEQARVFAQNRSSRPTWLKKHNRGPCLSGPRTSMSQLPSSDSLVYALKSKLIPDQRCATLRPPKQINSKPGTFLIHLRNTRLHIKMTVNQHNQIVWCTKRLFLHFTGTMSGRGGGVIWRTHTRLSSSHRNTECWRNFQSDTSGGSR